MQEHGLDPWSGTKIPHAVWQVKKKKKSFNTLLLADVYINCFIFKITNEGGRDYKTDRNNLKVT